MMKKFILVVLVTVFYMFFLSRLAHLYLADVFHTYSKNALSNGRFIKAEEYSQKAIERNPQEPSYYRQRAKTLLALSGLEDGDKEGSIKAQILNELEISKDLNEKNLTTLRNVIPLYYFLSLDDLAAASDPENIDEDYLVVTAKYFRRLKNTYSNDLGIISDVAEYEKKLSLQEDYEDSVRLVEKLRPDILEWHEAFR